MTKMKSFKTYSGYLRSAGDGLEHKRQMAKLDGKRPLSEAEGERQIINNLLLQIGVAERIGDAEKPADAVERMRQTTHTESQTKALEACASWLKSRVEVVSVTLTSVWSGPNETPAA